MKLAYASYEGEALMHDMIPVDDGLKLPAGMNFGSVSGVAIDTRGHIFILHRGPSPLMEFDAEGNFVRALGDGLFDRPHGLRVDSEDNIWTTDVAGHVVYKFSPAGRIEMVLGVRGRPGSMARLRPSAAVQRAERCGVCRRTAICSCCKATARGPRRC